MFRSPHSKDYFSNLFINIFTSKYLFCWHRHTETSFSLSESSALFWYLDTPYRKRYRFEFPQANKGIQPRCNSHWGGVFTGDFFFPKGGNIFCFFCAFTRPWRTSLHLLHSALFVCLFVFFPWTCIVESGYTDLSTLIALDVMKSSTQWRL